MDELSPPDSVHIASSTIVDGGRGVFASTDIPAGSCIEKCPVTTLEPTARKHLRKTGLVNYYFLWKKDGKTNVSICFGYGSIYNHSFEPNARYIHNAKDDRMDFYALEDIAAGEEIFVNYNGDPTDDQPLNIPGIPGSDTEKGLPIHERLVSSLLRRAKHFISRLRS